MRLGDAHDDARAEAMKTGHNHRHDSRDDQRAEP